MKQQRFAVNKVLLGSAAIAACGAMLLPMHPIEGLAIGAMIVVIVGSLIGSIVSLIDTFTDARRYSGPSDYEIAVRTLIGRYLVVCALIGASCLTGGIVLSALPIEGSPSVFLLGLTVIASMFLLVGPARVGTEAYLVLDDPKPEETAEYFGDTKTCGILYAIFALQHAFVIIASALAIWEVL